MMVNSPKPGSTLVLLAVLFIFGCGTRNSPVIPESSGGRPPPEPKPPAASPFSAGQAVFSIVEGETLSVSLNIDPPFSENTTVSWSVSQKNSETPCNGKDDFAQDSGKIEIEGKLKTKMFSLGTKKNPTTAGERLCKIQLAVEKYEPFSFDVKVTKSLPPVAKEQPFKLSGKGFHNCVLQKGSVRCWGYNFYGQVGIAEKLEEDDGVYSPVKVNDLQDNVTDIGIGDLTSCAVKNGAAYCWGCNHYGVLGIGDAGYEEPHSVPQPVKYLTSGVTKIAVGLDVACAIKGGGLYCWGYNGYGSIGDGTKDDRYIPTAVQNMGTGVTSVDISSLEKWWDGAKYSGSYNVCAIKNSAAYCWGGNPNGEVAEDLEQKSVPTAIVWPEGQVNTGVTAIGLGMDHVCAIKDNSVYCWGNNDYGQIGVGGDFNAYPSPTKVASSEFSGKTFLKLAVGSKQTCVVVKAGPDSLSEVYCWGNNESYSLGNTGYPYYHYKPIKIGSLKGSRDLLLSGTSYDSWGLSTLAIIENSVFGSGTNRQYGQLGIGDTQDRDEFVKAFDL